MFFSVETVHLFADSNNFKSKPPQLVLICSAIEGLSGFSSIRIKGEVSRGF